MEPIRIPPGVNVYRTLVEDAKQHPRAAVILRAMQDTLAHFNIDENDYAEVGDAVQRMSMAVCLNGPMILNTEDKGLHYLADMVDWFHNRSVDLFDEWRMSHPEAQGQPSAPPEDQAEPDEVKSWNLTSCKGNRKVQGTTSEALAEAIRMNDELLPPSGVTIQDEEGGMKLTIGYIEVRLPDPNLN